VFFKIDLAEEAAIRRKELVHLVGEFAFVEGVAAAFG
jgi:hypothetical protein